MNDQKITNQADEESEYFPLNGFEALPDAILAQLCIMGGKLPGYGGGDKVLVLLEPGEFVVRKEAAAHYGEPFLLALNDMRLGAGIIDKEHADGSREALTINFNSSVGSHTEQARENLEQLEDNSKAVGALTTVLNFISMMQAKPRCEICGEWHDILASNGVVGGLYAGLHALSQYSALLADETKQGLAEHKEMETATERP